MLKSVLSSKLGTFLVVTLAFGLIQFANSALTEFLQLVPGADLFNISSGFKFVFVLIAGWIGAFGVVVATFCNKHHLQISRPMASGWRISLHQRTCPLLGHQTLRPKLWFER
jgi:hypothetical protein